ncbi:MAG: glucosidase [Chlamydiae bacterium]|nr:glucosidase [Chlamydiota bacterium]
MKVPLFWEQQAMLEKRSKEAKRISEESHRLAEGKEDLVPRWQKWGPYVSERAWGTVREDYSANGDSWSYFPHDLAAAKAYRWGEDAICGWSDRYQVLVLAPAFWNGIDPILKERLFGLNSHEGNHGEDVKEYSYQIDATPTHSYMKYLYKYPQDPFPYQKLVEENHKRRIDQREYELMDTGVFQEGRYFDIFIEYAKNDPEDLCIKIEIFNRSKDPASLHLLMQLWFRNQWSWFNNISKPMIQKGEKTKSWISITSDDTKAPSPKNLSFEYRLGKQFLYGESDGEWMFTENETNGSERNKFYKDGFHRKIIHGENRCNPKEEGTKACLTYFLRDIPPHGSVKKFFRFSNKKIAKPLKEVEKIIDKRKEEADRFFSAIHPKKATNEEKNIQRQALATLIWNKQIYLYDVNVWLKGDNPNFPPPNSRNYLRNVHWKHLNSMRVLLMPDKWEYPWFASWDLAFHCLTYSLVDIEYAKEQLWLLLFDQFQHPNGQIPAYEWEFSDLNPPVQAWAALNLYLREKNQLGKADRVFLEKCFHKLLINFAWWVNRVDNLGNNVFEGGFLGLDNITVIDRSKRLPGNVILEQSDGTGWMAMFCLNLMTIALELAEKDRVYESLATKFFEHYVYIAHAMKKRGNQNFEMWNEEDGFFYDVLGYPNGSFKEFRVRSLVGLIPLYAVEILSEKRIDQFPEFKKNFIWFLQNRKDLVDPCILTTFKNKEKYYVLALMNEDQLKRVVQYLWDPKEFRGAFGLRSLSRFHEKTPFSFENNQVKYEPNESLEKIKGGNSNWRGPVWIPTTFLLIQALKKFSQAFEDRIQIQIGDEETATLSQIANSYADRIISIFRKNRGKRPVFGEDFPFHEDENWSEFLLFHEYYNPETGKGLGASHQSWSCLVANLIDEFRK